MINTTIRYIVYTHTGGGVRHHHFGTQNNIIDEAHGQASNGDTINALGFASLLFNGATLPFAFMSVNGAADGNHLYTSPGNQTVPVGDNDIVILAVYAPPGGGIGDGRGGPGIWVDAFNVDIGDFSDSLDFITVLTPPTPPDTVDVPKTSWGNQDGTVPTAQPENVRANMHVDGVPFLEWKRIVQAPLLTDNNQIALAQNQTGEIWFAFYQSHAPSQGVEIPDFSRTMVAMQEGIFIWAGDGYCGNGGYWIGPGHHPPGPDPYRFKITIDKSVVEKLKPAEQKKLKSMAAEYTKIAGTALKSMTQALAIVQDVDTMMAGLRQR